MSYITDQFQTGQVTIHKKVCGWYFNETDEFRPLMSDAMKELNEAGLVSLAHVDATAHAYSKHAEQTLIAYAKRENEFWANPSNAEAQRERSAEMLAAFGAGETVVNALTGQEFTL